MFRNAFRQADFCGAAGLFLRVGVPIIPLAPLPYWQRSFRIGEGFRRGLALMGLDRGARLPRRFRIRLRVLGQVDIEEGMRGRRLAGVN